jgi:hypothetical protein
MDSKTLIKALKIAVREVIKEELTEILREGLQSTINEMKQPKQQVKVDPNKIIRTEPRMVNEAARKPKVQFSENKWASVLNETDALTEQGPMAMNSFKELMAEGMDEIRMTSKDAMNFGAMRQNMKEAMGVTPSAPKVMEDPETGKVYEVDPVVQQAMTRDYSALMKAINKKKTN